MQAAILLIACALVGSCYGAGLPYKPCDGATAIKIVDIEVFNSTWKCSVEPCPIIKGADISINITFANAGTENITGLTNKVYGVVGGIPLPFPGFPDDMEDVCARGITSCPIKPGDQFTEEVILPITPAAPNFTVVCKWEFKSTSGTEVGCFEIQLKIEG